MSEQLPVIIVLAPLFGALVVGLAGPKDHRVCFPAVLASLLVSFCAAIAVAWHVHTNGVINYFVGGWESPRGIGIQIRIDQLNALVLIVIGVVSVLVSIFSIRPVGDGRAGKTPQFYTLYCLLCVGLFGMTVTGDAFNLFVLVEVSSLTSYALIAMGNRPRGTLAAFNYILMGTVGASFYLLGVGYIYLSTGALNMEQIHSIIAMPEVAQSNSIKVAFIFILVGVWTKMAFFPLHGWLPNAYSYCPASTSCLLAPLMTKVSVYVMIRVILSIFGAEWVFGHTGWSNLVVWLGVIAIMAGSILALAQRELKKMLCYLIVAEVGYMVGGAWLADEGNWGLTGAVFHILGDSLMTLSVFLVASIFAKKIKATRLEDLEGLFKRMPLVMAGFVTAALALIGVPPTCGFYSKFYLIRGAMDSGHWEYVIALILSSLVNAVLFFRIFEIAYFGNKPAASHGHDEAKQGGVDDLTLSGQGAPFTFLFPLLTSAALIVILGIYNGEVVEFIRIVTAPK